MNSRTGLAMAAATLAAVLQACSSQSSSTATTTAASPAPAKMASANKSMAAASNGSAVFAANCASCHSSTGQGGVGPPLAKNSVVTGDPKRVIHIVKNGLTGTIKVNGQSYNGTMPAWKATLSNGDIAAVITYIRSSWGNHASAVTSAMVASTK